MLLMQQQELSEKIEAQQAAITRMTEGVRMLKMMTDDDVEAFLESFERTALSAG